MKKRVRLTDKEIVDIVGGYTIRMERVRELAARYGISRAGIYEVLKRNGVDTHKGGSNIVLYVSCCVCGEMVPRYRSEVRRRKKIFCSEKCTQIYQKNGLDQPAIVRQRSEETARAVVSQHFALRPGNIVHRENDNDFDNDPRNLKVFASRGDHVRYHQGAIVPILWDGAAL